MNRQSVLLLSGSHRGKKTTTNSLLDYVERKLSALNSSVIREQVSINADDEEYVLRISKHIQESRSLILCFPLYFDTLPYPLLSLLERIVRQKERIGGINMSVIVHCGLPEPVHCENALKVCRCFADTAGMRFIGEAIVPDTGAIDGHEVHKVKRIRTTLDEFTELIISRNETDSVTRLIAKPSMCPFSFRLIANMLMKYFARKNNADIFEKVYPSE